MTTITQVITALPTAPDPATMTRAQFSAAAAASVLAQKAMTPEINTWADQANAVAEEVNANTISAESAADAAAASASAAINAPTTSATSPTSMTAGTGAKSFVLAQTGKAFALGQWVTITDTSAPTSTWMAGVITAYNAGTGAMTVNATVAVGYATSTTWAVVASAPVVDTAKTAPNFPNSSTQVAQRAGLTSNLSTTRQIGQVDNVIIWASGGTVSAGTLTQVTTAISGTTGYAARAAGVTLTGAGQISHSIQMEAHDAVKYKNKTVSFSVKVDHDVGSNINYVLVVKKPPVSNVFGTQSTIATSSATSVVTATVTTLTFNGVSVGDCSNGLVLEVQAACGAVTTKNFNCTEFSADIAATAQTYAFPDIENEQSRCLRYLPSLAGVGTYGEGHAWLTTVAFTGFGFKVPPLFKPTGVLVISPNNFQLWDGAGSLISTTAITLYGQVSHAGATLQATVASGLTVRSGTSLAGNNAACQILFTGSELI